MFRSSILCVGLIFPGVIATHAFAQTESPVSSGTVRTAPLTVSITGLRNDKGQVFIQLWKGPDGFPVKDSKGYKLVTVDASKAANGTVTAVFEVAPGTYAVSTLHDENRNGKMDTNALGIPKEGYGSSNNVVSRFHAPSYDQAKFEVPASGQKISVTVHY